MTQRYKEAPCGSTASVSSLGTGRLFEVGEGARVSVRRNLDKEERSFVCSRQLEDLPIDRTRKAPEGSYNGTERLKEIPRMARLTGPSETPGQNNKTHPVREKKVTPNGC